MVLQEYFNDVFSSLFFEVAEKLRYLKKLIRLLAAVDDDDNDDDDDDDGSIDLNNTEKCDGLLQRR